MNLQEYIAKNTSFREDGIIKVVDLIENGATVPFIARYRKDATGNLNEEQIEKIVEFKNEYNEIVKRKNFILESIEAQNKLNDDLKQKIEHCFDIKKLEDIYLPFKLKKQNKSDKAIKAGLAPLAAKIMKQENGDIFAWAERFLSKDFSEPIDALNGAADIIIEWINHNEVVRDYVRNSFINYAILTSSLKDETKESASKYADFYDSKQAINKCPSYRLLAILRGENEGVLKVKIEPDRERILTWLEKFYIKANNDASDFLKKQIKIAYSKNLYPAFENETASFYKKIADENSVKTFAKNLEKLLLAPPLGNKIVMGIDPGFKSGCKVVVIDEVGNLKTNVTIFPHAPQNETSKAQAKIAQLVETYKIDAIAIGDGTAGRETESFIKKIRFNTDIQVFVVREDGASVYSASKIAREEFPDFDVTVRGAVSIARRLQDPLAELIKIEPKSLGVGQYQHDVDQHMLANELQNVVVHAVNKVGVDVNTASKYLLSHVSGLGPKLAENFIHYRNKNGLFKSRNEFLKVERLGEKAFEQAAGFLRIKNAENLLDNSAVHPESYKVVQTILKSTDLTLKEVIGNKEKINELRQRKDLETLVGVFTYHDILTELEKPGLDPRRHVKIVEFDKSIKTINDLKIGHELMGIIVNVTDFGAFVTIGIKENGLLHRSKLNLNQGQHITDMIAINQPVKVRIESIDTERKRIGLELVSNY